MTTLCELRLEPSTHAARPSDEEAERLLRERDLRLIVHGSPNVAEACARLTQHLLALDALIRSAYGVAGYGAIDTASEHIRSIASMAHSGHGLCARRAMLLFAIHVESEVRSYFQQASEASASLVDDLHVRVLPSLLPWHISGLCQNPQFLCNQVSILVAMWSGEPIYHGAFSLSLDELAACEPDGGAADDADADADATHVREEHARHH